MNSPLLAFGLGTPELVILLVIVVVIFGVGKLADAGKEIGKGIRGFKEEMNTDEARREIAPDSAEGTPRDVTEERSQQA